MTKLLTFIRTLARGRVVLSLFAILAVAMLSIHVVPTPWSLVRFRALTGGVEVLDMEPHYTSAQAYMRLAVIGVAGRDFYLHRILLGVDVFLPALMALTLSVAIRYTIGGTQRTDDRLEWLALIPWVGALLDYLENVCIGYLIVDFPAHREIVGAIAGWVTSAKLLGYTLGVVTLIGLGAVRLIRATRVSRGTIGAIVGEWRKA